MKEVIEQIKQLGIGKIEENIVLSKYTTYKTGGTASCIVYPKDIEKLVCLLKLIRNKNIEYKILGNGSNLLFSDREYKGILIKLTELNQLEIIYNKIRVGAGFSLIKLSRIAARNSLTGLEFASGIPGTVGGAVFMNAGAYKKDMGYIVRSVKVLTPDYRIIELENKELNFHYRTSFFKTHPDFVCLEANIRLEKGSRNAIEDLMKSRLKRRLESQPLNYPSAGSVFRNPEGMYAGEIIENLGLKGFKIGGAMVSDQHANFIINVGNATSKDIMELICYVKNQVKEKYDILLKVEQEFVNWE
ncbi:MAG: UDP-N-acetylmuramate dehydrogenase [Bacilli bacterium]|nr:UDP-N-acetylmuramate dehydrogenase [Bacilli bacterium]